MADMTIDSYHAGLTGDAIEICDALRTVIGTALSDAESKVWHGAPVWFLDGNPIVGYAQRRSHVQLLFWSGQSFPTPGLTPEGTFKAAEQRITALDEIDPDALERWLDDARRIQWDYKNIVKRKGELVRLI